MLLSLASTVYLQELYFPLSWQCFRALCCKGPPPARPEYDLVCIGLTGSGKTSLLSKLCSENPDSIVSTTGGCWAESSPLLLHLQEALISFAFGRTAMLLSVDFQIL